MQSSVKNMKVLRGNFGREFFFYRYSVPNSC